MKTLILVGSFVASWSTLTFAQDCYDGQLVTVARSFQADVNGRIVSYQPGTLLQLDQIDVSDDRVMVDFAKVKGTGVLPIRNQLNEISGCSVQTTRLGSAHLCVGGPGYCASPLAPKALYFNECSIVP